jgi:hypothetical protein
MKNRTLPELEQMAESIGPNFDEEFKQVHHFSRPQFSTSPPTFRQFINYCKGLSHGIRPSEENDQTIQRTYRYLQLVSKGAPLVKTVNTVWEAFPLATRQ